MTENISWQIETISWKQNLKFRVLFTVFNIWSTDRKECHSGRGRGADNPAIKMEQKHLSEDR